MILKKTEHKTGGLNLFWKKKKNETDSISFDSANDRTAYRYDFKKGKGIQAEFKEKKVLILNISAGGIAFENKGFQAFDFGFIKLNLTMPNFKGDSNFYAGLRVLNINEENICHCLFEQCSLEQHELLHKYVLEMQKNDLAH
jgi:hypothetical protein